MTSTYSPLKLELMATGENSTTWGTVTNTNLDIALGEAIAGSASVPFTSADVTLTLTDTNASQTARNLRLNLTGTATAGYNLIVPAIEKPYIINNATDGTITVKNSSGTGTAVPAGKTMWVYNDGTNVTNAVTHLTSLTLAAALPVTSGGTGVTTSTGSGNNVLSTSPTLVTPILGTPTSGNLSNCTGVSLTTSVSGTLPVANGGTGATTLTGYVYGNGTSPLSAATSISGANISGNIPGSAANVTGTVAVANGGTGGTSQATAQAGLGVASATGSGASGTWGINISGNAATATSATTATNATNPAGGGSFITSLNIASQSVASATNATNATTATNPAGGGTFITSLNIASQSVASATNATNATTATTANALNVSNSYTAVDFTATSDTRLKDVYGPIIDALDKVDALSGFYYRNNDKARSLGQVKEDQQVGLSAQDLHEVLPEAVSRWSVDPEYLVVAYDRVIPLLVEAIKELRAEVKALKG